MALRPPSPGRIPICCPRGMRVKLTGERERLVYYVGESCRTKGAFSVSSKDLVVSVNHLETTRGRG